MSLENVLMMSDVDSVPVLEVGSVVIPNNIDKPLVTPKINTSYKAMYGFAIVVSVAPFVLVSERGDMRWETTVASADFTPVGKASADAMVIANTRLQS